MPRFKRRAPAVDGATDTPEVEPTLYLVYQFGCMPLQGEALMVAEMRRRNTLWNTLVDIDHTARAAQRQAVVTHSPAVGDAAAAVVQAELDYQAQRKAEQVGHNQPDPTNRKPLRAEYKRILKTALADPVLQADLVTIEQQRLTARKQAARGEASGLYWCNSDAVVTSYETARRRAIPALTAEWVAAAAGLTEQPGGPDGLRFHAWRGARGGVSVRFQQGLPARTLFARTDTRLQLAPLAPDAYAKTLTHGERLRAQRTSLRLRLGSDPAKRTIPLWGEVQAVVHRPIPADATIRTATIQREQLGTRYRWSCTLTMTTPGAPPVAAGAGTIGIDLGWRRLADGLRVATWRDSWDQTGYLLLPEGLVHGPEVEDNGFVDLRQIGVLRRHEQLQGVRDDNFNRARAELIAWLAGNATPEWLREETKTLAQWRAKGRLDALVQHWAQARFAGDDTMFARLAWWRGKDRHLWDWQANERDQAQMHRLHIYRNFAAWVARTYQVVRLEQFDLRRVTRLDQDAEDLPDAARHYRTMAALSTLRLALDNACRRSGVTVERVDARDTTRVCHACGVWDDFDAAAELVHTWPCGHTWDQDVNAAAMIVRGGAPAPQPAPLAA